MKISEFANMNNVTTKMLRHYDKIGLLKPSLVDPQTGYRSYDEKQSNRLNWIIILKNLEFSLVQIKQVLSGRVDAGKMIRELLQKRIEISSAANEEIQKKILIDRLIRLLEEEGFQMEKQVNLLAIDWESVNEIKKNIPNNEMFLESVRAILASCSENDDIAVFRYDISHFKSVNDDYGYEVGDKVILTCYNIIRANMDKHFGQSAVGRSHGDEFVVFAKAGREAIEKAARGIMNDMESFDFSAVGCMTKRGCYIGALVSVRKYVPEIRKMIDDTFDAIEQARKNGVNSYVIRSFTGNADSYRSANAS